MQGAGREHEAISQLDRISPCEAAAYSQQADSKFTLTLNNKGGETFTQAHIHKASAGVNGPIHWDFFLLPDPDLTGPHPSLRGVASPRAVADLADLLANPDQY